MSGYATHDGISPLFEAWAIRHKPTGAYLPVHWNDRCGYSRDEPTFDFPRLFKSKRAAQSALNRWLDGEWYTKTEYEYEDGYRAYGYQTEPQVKPVAGRVASDMEIARFTLSTSNHRTPTSCA